MGHIRGKFREARLLHQARVGHVVTMAQVAGAIKITRQALSDLELGHSLPNHITLARLCAFYGVQPGDLLVYVEEWLSLQATPG